MLDFIPMRARVFLKLRTSLLEEFSIGFTLRHGRYVGVSKQKNYSHVRASTQSCENYTL